MSGLNRPVGGPVLLGVLLVLLVLGTLVIPAPRGPELGYALQPVWMLVFGWVGYLGRVLPEVKPDPGSVVTGVIYFAAFVVGSHLFLRWLYAATGSPSEPRRWPLRWTLRATGLVVLMFVAGIAATGIAHQTGWLLNSPEPLMQPGYGDDTRQMSRENLRQLAGAPHPWKSAPPDGVTLPVSTFDSQGRPRHSWQTHLLPFLEQYVGDLKHDLPWDHPENKTATSRRFRMFMHPVADPQIVDGYGASHYAGNAAVVIGDRPKNLNRPDDFPLGVANTILAGEVNAGYRPWADPLNARDPPRGTGGGPDAFGSPLRSQKPQFAMCDASVRTFDPKELADLMAGKVPE